MAQRVLLRDDPQRAIALITDSYALVLRHSASSTTSDIQGHGPNIKFSSPRCMVEFSALSAINLTDYRLLSSGGYGTLGLININADVFLCVVSGSVRVATVRPGETVQRITSVEFYCLNKGDFDHVLHDDINPYPTDSIAPNGYDHGHGSDGRDAPFEHPCLELKRILSSGTFYYSVNFDLTNRLQDRISEGSAFDVDSLDEDFLWNSYMIDPLIKFRSRLADHEKEALDASHILTSAIRGFVSTILIPPSSSPVKASRTNLPSGLTLISRLSCRRAGTRFNSRGIDDDGYVANFVETETTFYQPSGLCFSYAQIRGSVPIFWEQAPGLLPGQQKIQITRSAEATQPAFDKHFEQLSLNYGNVHILNLLSETKPGEVEISARYRAHIAHSPLNQILGVVEEPDHRELQESHFDFHAETKGPGGYEAASLVRRLIQNRAEGFAYFLSDEVTSPGPGTASSDKASHMGPTVVLQQEGVFRTNCLDCLDRTNLIQTIINQMAFESFLSHRGERASADFWMRHSSLWADNGDALSKIYAGTGALKSSFTRHGKMSLAGAIADARKSATRMYINNFADKGRQNTIDMLLGRLMDQSPVHLYDPINDHVNAELKRRLKEYSTSRAVHIYVGTFNLNGKGNGVKEDLSSWLCPKLNSLQQNPEVVAVGFQEIVELSPQQIMSTDPVRRQAWEIAVRKTLNENARKRSTEEYVLLRSGQLVGAALLVFVKASALSDIKNVEGSVKKTGMSGMAGNKGAVAIRMDYANTRICFVTAHLAAGFANYEERNRDYRTINSGLRFQRNRSIEDHDTIIWLGDFNYRIGLSDDKVRRLIDAGDLERLYQNDQLNLQMVAGRTFPFYSEARITFLPTYKYDNGTDDYDTSEKGRIPAWCDRVLRKGDNLKQINYTTAPLRFSDHRPVYATFQCMISAIDEEQKKRLSWEIYAKRKADVGDTTANARNGENEDEDLIGYESIAPGLPPASSDRRKWWLDNGIPVRSNVGPPEKNSTLNVSRPSNPFIPTNEPDWVVDAQPTSTQKVGQQARQKAPLSSNGPTRMLPPPFDPDAKIPFDNSRNDSGLTTIDRALQKSRASSVASITSSTSGVTRKPAPPVPKKPILLSKPNGHKRSNSKVEAIKIPARRGTLAGPEQTTGFRPPLRTNTGVMPAFQSGQRSSVSPPTAIGQQQRPLDDDSPDLPPRRPTDDLSNSRGLMDEDDDGARAIPSLQPLRRP